MTKRALGKFQRSERDFYATPEEPILALLPHILEHEVFAEPMCGDGAIVKVLEDRGWVAGFLADLEPQGDMSGRAEIGDVMFSDPEQYDGVDVIVSNPPWPAPLGKLSGREMGWPTIPIIKHLSSIKPTWLLMSADFMHNKYFEPLHRICVKVVSVGRVSWQGNGKKGFDNAAWYLFDAENAKPSDWFVPNKGIDKGIHHPSLEVLL